MAKEAKEVAECGGRAAQVGLELYQSIRFNPHIFSAEQFGSDGCGGTALALITGLLSKRKENDAHWSASEMIEFLEKHNYQVIHFPHMVKHRRITDNVAHPRQVLLLELDLAENERSWFVLWNGLLWHNFHCKYIDETTFINKPVTQKFIIHHEYWLHDYLNQDKKKK